MGLKEKLRFPDVPASLQHDSFELQNVQLDDAASASTVKPPPVRYDAAGSITPYLGLRARLSQVWLNRWTVLVLLVLVHVLLTIGSLNGNIDDAQSRALAACTKVEDVGSAMASMPHYLSVGVNNLAADGISKAVRGMVDVLMMILTGVEQLILFVINMYIGTYVCLTSALVHGTLDVGIGAADEVTSLMNKAIDGITDTISSDVSSVQDTINSVFKEIASASSIFGKTLTAPIINITGSLDDLKNIQVDDTAFVATLAKLNSSLPTYDEAENATRHAISVPFEAVKTLLNDSYGGYQFDTSVFPVAKKEALTFCSDNSVINDFFKKLYEVAADAKTAFIAVLVVLAVLAAAFMAWVEIRSFRSQQRRARVLAEHGGFDPMDVVYIASRPHAAGLGLKLGRWAGGGREGSAKRQLLLRWAVAYATSMPALFVLSLAVAGLLSCLLQAVLLHAVQKEAPALTTQVSDFANSVVSTLEDVSTSWADDANAALLDFQDRVNEDVLDYVVNATSAVNHTLNIFTDEINEGITAAFNGTVLDNTVRQIVRCLIGLKIDAVEQGLTWVHDHAHITVPLFANDTFSAGASDSLQSDSSLTSFLADPGSTTSDDITAAVDKVVTFLRNGVVQEALISAVLLLLYVIVVLIGMMRMAVGLAMPDRTRAEGGQVFYPDSDPTEAVAATAAVATAATPAPSYSSSSGRHPFPTTFDNVPESGTVDDYAAAATRERKLADILASSKKTVPGGPLWRAEKKNSHHWRSSSYGNVDDADTGR